MNSLPSDPSLAHTPDARPLPQTLRLQALGGPPQVWAQVVQAAAAFLGQQGVEHEHAVLVLPFAQLAEPARAAWSKAYPKGFLPAFESTLSWGRRLPPASAEAPLQGAGLTGDRRVDVLAAQAVLAGARHPALKAATQQHAQTLWALASELLHSASVVAPQDRDAWWRQASEAAATTTPNAGRHAATDATTRGAIAAADAVLLQLACAWAQQSAPPVTDALWGVRPAAVVAVFAGPAPLLAGLVTHWRAAGVSVLTIELDARAPVLNGPAQPAEALPPAQAAALREGLRFLQAQDAEHEAWLAAQAVLAALAARGQDDERPVALVAQDRLVVRRVRALLDRQAVPMIDETGWALSTTRAAALVVGLLRATLPEASTDEVLAWLRSLPAPQQGQLGLAPYALNVFEAHLRRAARHQAADVMVWRRVLQRWPSDPAVQLHQQALAELLALVGQRRASLWQWLQALRGALDQLGLLTPFSADAAGQQVLAALGVPDNPDEVRGDAFFDAAHTTPMDSRAFLRWVADTLEADTFSTERGATGPAPAVLITPLARAGLRDFAAWVVPGCNADSLGQLPPLVGGWTAAQRLALGLPHLAELHTQAEHQWALVVASGAATCIGRVHQGDQALAVPALVQRTQRALGLGWAVPPAGPQRAMATPANAMLQMPAPRLGLAAQQGLLPQQVSATAYADLRTCPYRFFALRVLGLQEATELDDTLAPRDWGVWLHDVLRRFHEERHAKPGHVVDAELLDACAKAAARGLDEAQALPYLVGWPPVAQAYLAWLSEHEARGLRFGQAEVQATRELVGPDHALTLQGRLDRVDQSSAGEVVIDYKTGRPEDLARQVREPGEDVQLAFYGLLRPQAIAALYLSLRDGASDAPVTPVELPHLQDAAATLADGLHSDWVRLAQGQPMPALGELPACGHCAAAGLCRKAHWGAGNPAAEGGRA